VQKQVQVQKRIVGRKVRAVVARRAFSGSFDYAQDRLFALERRAQDDSKNRQRQVQKQKQTARTNNDEIRGFFHFTAFSVRMTNQKKRNDESEIIAKLGVEVEWWRERVG
jgi:hypothetical protein